jgi:hypothetical protein
MPTLKAKPDWLRADTTGRAVGVDREKATIHGAILAEAGPFKSEGRGEFDGNALKAIVRMIKEKPKGLRSRFTHPSLSSDGLGTYLGRVTNARRDKVMRPTEDGKFAEVEVVRGDLKFDPTAFKTPSGDLASYLMELAESDEEAFGTSLVLKADQSYRLDSKKRPLTDEKTGKELPPLWMPTALLAVDCVDTGDATNSMLSIDGMPDEIVRRGTELLDQQFADQPREVVKARAQAWLDRYLTLRFGEPEETLAELDDAADVTPEPVNTELSKTTSRSVAEMRAFLAEKHAIG